VALALFTGSKAAFLSERELDKAQGASKGRGAFSLSLSIIAVEFDEQVS
jgi:hypothetical protein